MTKPGAETAVTVCALIVTGFYVYRRVSEKVTKTPSSGSKPSPGRTITGALGQGELLPTGSWVTGAGVTFIGLSILAQINANLGGYTAILVAAGSVYANGSSIINDVGTNISKSSEAARTKQAAQAPQAPQPASGTSINHPPT